MFYPWLWVVNGWLSWIFSVLLVNSVPTISSVISPRNSVLFQEIRNSPYFTKKSCTSLSLVCEFCSYVSCYSCKKDVFPLFPGVGTVSCLWILFMYSKFFCSTTCKACPKASMSTCVGAGWLVRAGDKTVKVRPKWMVSYYGLIIDQ